MTESQKESRSLRGNVDRNGFGTRKYTFEAGVVPYVGTWIEIDVIEQILAELDVVPYVGTWIEIVCQRKSSRSSSGRSLRGNVDRN